jgi:hypothetical protein
VKSEKRKINYEIVKKNVTFAKQKEKVYGIHNDGA